MDDFASRNEMEKMRRALAEFHESRTQMNKALDQIKVLWFGYDSVLFAVVMAGDRAVVVM